MPHSVTAPPEPAVRWVAYADGVAHAYHRGGARGLRSLCTDVRALPERFDRPATSRCPRCVAVADGLDVPEGENRLIWGGR